MMTPSRLLTGITFSIALTSLSASASQILTLSEDSRQSVSLTLYQNNLALIEETRSAPALPANSPVILSGVSPQMLAETLQVEGAGQILEQNLESNTLDLQHLLQQQIGQSIHLMRFNPATGGESERQVKLLRIEGAVLLVENAQGRVETLTLHDGQWRLALDAPESYQLKPSLSFKSTGTQKPGNARLLYLSRGLSWNMDYVLGLDAKGEQVDLQGLATLNNTTDMQWPNARIKLLAGQVNEPSPNYAMEQAKMMLRAPIADAAGSAGRSGVQDYHLYTLKHALTLEPQQQKQIPLIQQQNLPARIHYRQQIQVTPHQQQPVRNLNPEITLGFEAPSIGNDRTPLPAGQVRVFRPDSEGQLQFIGGSQLEATAAGDQAEVVLGKAFDLEVEYEQTAFNKLFIGYEISYAVTLSNRSEETKPFVLNALIPLPFKLVQSDLAPAKTTSSRMEWSLDLQPGEERVINFSVKLIKS